jgi:hypothetical protein
MRGLAHHSYHPGTQKVLNVMFGHFMMDIHYYTDDICCDMLDDIHTLCDWFISFLILVHFPCQSDTFPMSSASSHNEPGSFPKQKPVHKGK